MFRRLVASGLALSAPLPAAAAHCERSHDPGMEWLLYVIALAPICAGLALASRRFQAALLGRAVLWSYVVWIVVVAIWDSPPMTAEMLWFGVAPGLALLLAPRDALDTPSGHFVPKAFHGTLVAVITMALADTLALGFWSTVATSVGARVSGGALAAAAGIMSVAVYGLLRLRTWAFALNIGANVVIATGAWWVPDLPTPIAIGLTATAIGQLLAGSPVLLGVIKGRAPAPEGGGTWSHLISAVVVSMLILVLLFDFVSNGSALAIGR